MAQGEGCSMSGKQRLDFAALNRGIKRKASTSSAPTSSTMHQDFFPSGSMATDNDEGREQDGEKFQDPEYTADQETNEDQQLDGLDESQLEWLDATLEYIRTHPEPEDATDVPDEAWDQIEEDAQDQFDAPEHYQPILKHCERRLKHHSHKELHYFYEILRYRKLAGLATNPSQGGTTPEDKGKSRHHRKDSMEDRKWKLYEVYETGVAMNMKFKGPLAYNELLHLMFGKENWDREIDTDMLSDDVEDAGEGAEDDGINPLDELD